MKKTYLSKLNLGRLLTGLLVMVMLAGAAPGAWGKEQWSCSNLAARNFTSGNGLGFLVDLSGEKAKLERVHENLPLSIYNGKRDTIAAVNFGTDQKVSKSGIREGGWEYVQGVYELDSGQAVLTVNRLSPAVLLDSPAQSVGFDFAVKPRYMAYVSGGKIVTKSAEEGLDSDGSKLDEPWILLWFGAGAPRRAHIKPFDVEDEQGVSKLRLQRNQPDELDLPILLRLEHQLEFAGLNNSGEFVLRFGESVGKVALMPLMGAKIVAPGESKKWMGNLPDEAVAQCRRWSRALRDYPLSAEESFQADLQKGQVRIKQDFEWISFDDDWGSEEVRAAPVGGMLWLAAKGQMPIEFYTNGRKVEPVDYEYMDTAGEFAAIEGADSYEYVVGQMNELLDRGEKPGVSAGARTLQKKLEREVNEMIEAGHLAPLLYIYGGIGGTWFSHFYWANTSELAAALEAARPYLSDDLQKKVIEYVKNEWRVNPPFEFNADNYTKGKLRTPYEFVWEQMGNQLKYAMMREADYRKSDYLFDLYGIDAYYSMTGEKPDEAMKDKFEQIVRQFLENSDWALLGPSRIKNIRDRHAVFYYNLQGAATYNRWLAGAIGFTRIARRNGWEQQAEMGMYLAAKLTAARVGIARYVSQMHENGLVAGPAEEDNRCVVHIDTGCVIIGRGPMETGVHQNQEAPPFNDLTEEVGRLLGKYASEECGRYLRHMDYSLPLWYISEAPKQQATEHRTTPLQYYNGNVLAQYWILHKRRDEFSHYIDTSRFTGDLYYIQNLAAGVESWSKK